MATAAVTNTFVNGQTADADDVNTNFADLVGFLNNSVVHKDGAVVLTGTLDMGGFAFKNVGNYLRTYLAETTTTRTIGTDATYFDWATGQLTVTDPGVPVRVMAWAMVRHANTTVVQTDVRVRLDIDGDDSNPPYRSQQADLLERTAFVQHVRSFDPSGNFIVKVQVFKNGGGNVDFTAANIGVLVMPQ